MWTEGLTFKATDRSAADRPLGLLAILAVVFGGSVAGTVYSCRSMCCEMDMPGGWTMSMMWMRMPGYSWAGSAALFLLMWLTMMVAMMLPSALPMLMSVRRTVREQGSRSAALQLASVWFGYFSIWLVIGVVVYGAGVGLGWAAMRWAWLSRMVPALSSAALVAAGAAQFSRWKMRALQRCRDPLGCTTLRYCQTLGAGWSYGLGQGRSCLVCCAAPMLVMMVLGSMNLVVMIFVAAIIAVEKLVPRPEPWVRLFGAAAIVMGLVMMVR